VQAPRVLLGGLASNPFGDVRTLSTGGVLGLNGGEKNGGSSRLRPRVLSADISRAVACQLG
jgi:hypothetical protein